MSTTSLPSMSDPELIQRPVRLELAQGLHIRACSRVVALVGSFNGQIRIHNGSRSADASSMFDLMQLAALPGTDLIIEGQGVGAEAVIDSLERFLSQTAETTE